MKNGLILSTAYYPPVRYFSEIYRSSEIYIEAHENYTRQTYRNRCSVLSGNGKLSLSVPIKNISGSKQKITDIKIDYSSDWQRIHIHAIRSAYGKSPFYDFYIDSLLEPISDSKQEFLFELNLKIITTINHILKINKKIELTTSYLAKYNTDINDYRHSIHPKKTENNLVEKRYIQTFSDRFGFISNLSILDLIFNTGPESTDYLK